MCLYAMLRFNVPNLDERIFARGQQEACPIIIRRWDDTCDHAFAIGLPVHSLVLRSTRLEKL